MRRIAGRHRARFRPIECRIGQGVSENFRHNASKSSRPGGLARRLADQILPDLNYGIGEAAPRAVLPQTVAFELPRIRFIIADDEVAFGIEAVEQRLGQAGICVPQDANMPGTRGRLPALRKGVDGKQRRCYARSQAPIDDARDCLVVGTIIKIDAVGSFAGVEAAIARYHRPVGQPHNQGRIVGSAVGIDQQPRVARQHGRHAKRGRKRTGDRGGSDIIGDVPAKLFARQAEGPVPRWQGVVCMIAQDDQASIGAPGKHAIAVRLLGRNAERSGSVVHHSATIVSVASGGQSAAVSRSPPRLTVAPGLAQMRTHESEQGCRQPNTAKCAKR